MLTNEEVYRKFVEADALLEGHFLLSSGKHSPTYLEKFLVLQYPKTVEAFCADLAERFRDQNIDVVLGPTTGGVLLAYETAKHLGTRGIFAESEGGKRVLRRGFAIAPGERVLLVDDILTSGSSVRDTIEVITEADGVLAGVGILADRSGGKVTFGVPQQALLTLDVVAYEADDCPLCKQGVPMTKRGTTAAPKMR
ncbi:MAG TPA: orotate phosphoribosyltransferase [Capsulimonadaceae bacterium]|jgi:orotate phosphoribosyltransferase